MDILPDRETTKNLTIEVTENTEYVLHDPKSLCALCSLW
jgi:hypothetical protein